MSEQKKINHSEAFDNCLYNQNHSNTARCYLELADFVKNELPLALAVLEEVHESGECDHSPDLEKAVWGLKEIIRKVKENGN